MEHYTLRAIRQTKVYQANIKAVCAIYPGHAKDFAKELQKAANCIADFDGASPILNGAFWWSASPQGHDPWSNLFRTIKAYGMGH